MSDSQKDIPEEEIAGVDVSQRAGSAIEWMSVSVLSTQEQS